MILPFVHFEGNTPRKSIKPLHLDKPAPLTPEGLRHPHSSIARNHRICEALFLARYIEKFGTGTLMMIRESLAHALPEPDFVQRAGELVTTVWRDWLTEKVLNQLRITERQRSAILHLRTHGKINNPDYRRLAGVSKPTASRDLESLRDLGVLARMGSTGKGTFYVLEGKGLILGSQRAQTAHAYNAKPCSTTPPSPEAGPVPVPSEPATGKIDANRPTPMKTNATTSRPSRARGGKGK